MAARKVRRSGKRVRNAVVNIITRSSARRDGNPAMRELRLRRAYVSGRLPCLKEEMKLLIAEKNSLHTDRPEAPSSNPDGKSLNRRRHYIAGRLEWLRNERKALIAERSELTAKFKTWAGPVQASQSNRQALCSQMQPAE
jgi:hypothetical protein